MADNTTQHTNHKNNTVIDEKSIQLITFHVQKQEYGINIVSIREIKGWVPTTTLPNTPPYVLGVINLRGAVVPIIDLSYRFGMGVSKPDSNSVVMIVMVNDRTMGILVDAVSDILTIPESDVRPIPSIDSGEGKTAVLIGVIEVNERMISILNLESVFDQSVEISDAASKIKPSQVEITEEQSEVKTSEKVPGESSLDESMAEMPPEGE